MYSIWGSGPVTFRYPWSQVVIAGSVRPQPGLPCKGGHSPHRLLPEVVEVGTTGRKCLKLYRLEVFEEEDSRPGSIVIRVFRDKELK
jgi:hypothetical protein